MGYNLSQSMSDIWNTSSSNIINGVGSVLGEYGTKMSDGISNINTVVNGISTAVQEMLRLSNEEAQRVADEIKRQQEAQQAGSSSSNNDWSGSDYNDWTDNWDSGSSDNGGESSSDGVDWIYEENYYPRDLLNIDQSVVDRLKWNNFASSFAARSQYYDQMGGEGQYYGTYDQNIFMLDYLKSHGLKKVLSQHQVVLHLLMKKVLVQKLSSLRNMVLFVSWMLATWYLMQSKLKNFGIFLRVSLHRICIWIT